MVPEGMDDVTVEDASVLDVEVLKPENICEWLEYHVDISAIVDSLEEEEELKSEGETHDGTKVATKAPFPPDGPPDDIRAFFGHPLTAATTAINGEDTHASAVALIHEYINLPTLDDSGAKIGDKINSIYDIMREDSGEREDVRGLMGPEQEYMDLIQTTLASDVDKFFIQETGDSTADESGSPPRSAGEEIIEDVQEICVTTTPLTEEPVEEDVEIYPHLEGLEASDTNNQRRNLPAIEESTAMCESAPLLASDLRTVQFERNSVRPSADVHRERTCSKVAETVETKVAGNEKPQELTKKLYKALTEKILRKRQLIEQQDCERQQTQQPPPVVASASTSRSSSTSPQNCSVGVYGQDVHRDVNDKLANFGDKDEVYLGDLTMAEETPVTAQLSTATATLVPQVTSHYTNSSVSSTQHQGRGHARGRKGHQSQSISGSAVKEGQVPGQCVRAQPPASCMQSSKTVAISQHSPPLVPPPPPLTRNLPHPMYLVNNTFNDAANHLSSGSVLPGVNGNSNGYYCNTSNNNTSSTSSHSGACAGNGVSGGIQNNGYPTTYPDTHQQTLPVDMLERYIHQQNQLFHSNPNFQYPVPSGKESYSMKSPDSGINEPCVSPPAGSNTGYKEMSGQYNGDLDPPTERVSKRRRSAPAMYVKQYWSEKPAHQVIPKLDIDPAGYKYFLETPISTTQRIEEDRITYLNKGQYYGLTLEHNGDVQSKSQLVKSVIMVVFREDKQLEDEQKAWEFWHSRQHSFKQRVIDIDTKNSTGVVPSSIEEISFNAVAVKWNPKDSPIKVNVAVHCLSTDFSNQKGVKGLPLHIQIDTYENLKDQCVRSRAYCQIKVFCDKGAERKTRDEEKRKQSRLKVDGPGSKARKQKEDVFHSPLDRSEFYPMADLQTQPVLFSPVFESDEGIARSSPMNAGTSNDEDGCSSITSSGEHLDLAEEGYFAPVKRVRTDCYPNNQLVPKILLYVRESHETVFTALMLRTPTTQGLLQAIEEKYKIPAHKLVNSYKRSKKGILVRMDDNIIQHFSHEATFIIELNQIGDDKDFEVVLTDIDLS